MFWFYILSALSDSRSLVVFKTSIYNIFVAENGKIGAHKPDHIASWKIPDISTERLKSVLNCCVIEVFC